MEQKALSLPLNFADRVLGLDLHPAGKCLVEQPLMIPCRVQRGMVQVHQPSMIKITADFLRLFCGSDQPCALLKILRTLLDVPLQPLVLPRCLGTVKAPDLRKIAVDVLFADELPNPLQSVDALLQNRLRLFRTKASGQLREVGLDAGADLSAIAGTAAPAHVLSLQNQGLSSIAGGLEGGTKPGVAGTDDGHVHLLGKLNVRKDRPRGSVPTSRGNPGSQVRAERWSCLSQSCLICSNP